jgi:hypothetical protein
MEETRTAGGQPICAYGTTSCRRRVVEKMFDSHVQELGHLKNCRLGCRVKSQDARSAAQTICIPLRVDIIDKFLDIST